ncbi:MAG: 4-aminobutyrate--2-oxoglutarate transaminase [Armatimonadota bacterium]|nr:4-aminobutyrate--2-oxoglutarate transaminase [Armatimonadota bacterium]MDR7458979.1 4-aminobutyrate--2-oxoglutarate transaminase [Armatimonadota bacterium]MDR7488282.1 4-aminobutyrate--2-oxoglutarate transaminase [Armatimonadota bacterium]MDR7574839.1 4-aminobutyrate--2-oxoglutarate transaminase [Armatimonadota bacterium]MDR7585342.1 4-aminobutyrate--2-oxoglutarate transaminase [Armatimonadota bacterium]
MPGPEARRLLRLREQYVPRGVATAVPTVIAQAEGARVRDVDGHEFIDFAAGIGTVNVGHRPMAVLEAVRAQLDRLLHTCAHVAMYEPYLYLAERLASVTPGTGAKKVLLVNSGAEAVENAVKIARAATGRRAVVCFEYAFHGRTVLALSLTSKVRPYKAGFGPFVPEVYRAPYSYPYRCPRGGDPADCDLCTGRALEVFLATHVDPAEVAAVIVEPVAGEGGFVVPHPAFLPTVAELCRRHGILLIADEIQTGFGRTGRLFAVEHAGVVPDLLVLSKSLAAGLPLAAVVGRAEVMDAPVVGGLGGTFGGNPLSCAAALAVLDLVTDPAFLERAGRLGAAMQARLAAMAQRYPLVGEARGLGAMAALELVRDHTTKEPAAEETGRVLRACHERGLLILKAGVHDNVVRLLPPLTISDEDLEDGLAILEDALTVVVG